MIKDFFDALFKLPEDKDEVTGTVENPKLIRSNYTPPREWRLIERTETEDNGDVLVTSYIIQYRWPGERWSWDFTCQPRTREEAVKMLESRKASSKGYTTQHKVIT